VGKFNVTGLLAKLGINVESVSRGAHAGMLSPFRDFTDEEREWLQAETDELYRAFLDRVAEGRSLAIPQVDAVAQGRVWTGRSARALGLVDSLGGLPLAMAMARNAAGLEADSPVEILPHVERSWYQRLFQSAFDESGELLESADPTGILSSTVVRAWLGASRLHDGRALALLPWSIEVR
jgi:ClpP class serine protease